MTHTITGIMPTPKYYPKRTAFDHHDSTTPTGSPRINGSEGRVITARSESLTIARQLADIMAKVLQDVRIDGEKLA